MLSVVVPTFNEGKNIRNLVTQIDDALKGIPYEIVFVDDSKDDTPQVIMEVAKDFPAVRMEHRTGETGLATAVLKGFSLAKGEYMACMDADLQHPPIVLKYMYKDTCLFFIFTHSFQNNFFIPLFVTIILCHTILHVVCKNM